MDNDLVCTVVGVAAIGAILCHHRDVATRPPASECSVSARAAKVAPVIRATDFYDGMFERMLEDDDALPAPATATRRTPRLNLKLSEPPDQRGNKRIGAHTNIVAQACAAACAGTAPPPKAAPEFSKFCMFMEPTD